MGNNNNIIYTARDIEQYLAGKLSPVQMHAMEKAAQDDPFLAEAMEGYEAMQNTEWNNELVALRTELAKKGTVAKVIPLHKPKNNGWKAAAAIFILGSGLTLTFLFTKNKTVEDKTSQIAEIIKTPDLDSNLLAINEDPRSVTVSLNPTASATKEDIAETKKTVANNISTLKTGDNTIPNPNGPQLKQERKEDVAVTADDSKIIKVPAAPPASSPVLTDNNTQAGEDVAGAKRKTADKPTAELEVINQRSQSIASSKKEVSFNNFFSAQVVAPDNSPLPFTNISIKKDNFGTYADSKGMIRLVSTDSILNVEVKSVGYKAKTYMLRNNQPQTKIILQEDEVAAKDRIVIGNGDIAAEKKSRRVTLITDSAVNVEPKDGWDNYNTYVANNLDIPDEMLKSNFHGEVELSFDVKSNGTISNIRVNKSLGADYDEAAKRLLLEGPQWKVKKGRKTSASVKVKF